MSTSYESVTRSQTDGYNSKYELLQRQYNELNIKYQTISQKLEEYENKIALLSLEL